MGQNNCIAAVCLAAVCLTGARAGDTERSGDAILFQDMAVVETATLHAQTLAEAPASVTVITDEEIRRFGYRTLGEALGSARGFYAVNDRIYRYVGVRGFNLPGDYNVRFLLMVNGHKLAENIYSSANWFGQDFGLDMDLVKRIEIIRGPSSALYGSNGIFATVNIITTSPVDHPAGRATTELGSFGEKKAMVSSSIDLGGGANLLVSASGLHNAGQSHYFPEYDRPETNNGWVHRADGERGYHTFANLIWGAWSFTGFFNNREKQTPLSWGETIFGDRSSKNWDSRNFVEAAWTRTLRNGAELRWRAYYDQYRWRGRYHFALEDEVEDNRDSGEGDWAGTQLTYSFGLPRLGLLTLGTELNADLRTRQRNYDVSPEYVEYLNVNTLDSKYAFFAQQEWAVSRRWKMYAGLRFDDARKNARALSPRLSLVYTRSPKTTFKFLYGRSFRHPSSFERFYDDNGVSVLPNPGLRSENAQTFEVAAERRIGRGWNAVASVYHYRLTDLIEGVREERGLLQYRNVADMRAGGAEFELNGRSRSGLEGAASIGVQQVTGQAGDRVPNSPAALSKLRGAFPVERFGLTFSAGVQCMGSRLTLSRARLEPACLADITGTTWRLHPNYGLQFGIRNLADRTYYDPVALVSTVDRIRQDGRAVFVKLIWRTAGDAPALARDIGAGRTGDRP
jgi:iron complex outermembrane receptor protein